MSVFALTEEYIDTVQDNARMSPKGYVIPKSCLDPRDLTELKDSLTVSPKESFGMKKMGNGAKSCPVVIYRENEHKIYIPRFFGTKRYGIPVNWDLDDGDNIDVPFVKSIRDYQEHIVTTYLNYVQNEDEIGNGGILEVPCGRGKCLGRDTPILMYDGSIKPVQDIVVGDKIMGDDSTPRKVLTLARGREKMYKIHDETTGIHYNVNESHILSLIDKNTFTVNDISVKELLSLSLEEQNKLKGYRVSVVFPQNIIETNNAYNAGKQGFVLQFMYSTQENRMKLLAGILDSELVTYTVKNNSVFVYLKKDSNICCQSLVFLSRSLGIHVQNISSDNLIVLKSPILQCLPTILPLKGYEYVTVTNEDIESSMMYTVQIIALEEDEYYGFEIDGNRRFVLGDFTVTHNTVMALNISARLKKKTFILVHKEFLMNQWIERIREFMPSARVGCIQGKRFEVDNCDIVIGMIQTLYDKPYPSGTFSSFGLTIIDEVHRIGSEEFSKTLLKVVTPYMLGISATVDRKDGLTELIHMFIGDKIYSEERETEDGVEVRAVQYEFFADEEYNEVEHDFRGNVKFSTMINKISDFGPRRRFIVRFLQDLMKENSEKQIMVLSHKRDLLEYLRLEIERLDFASCGLYVGGMKPAALQETEGKEVVLATYAMAAEALDIKTLNTLVMVSPKTDIVQSVGRILRTKGDGKIIVDIVDSHDVFQNQWRKRRAYYNSCDYKVKMCKSCEYKGMKNETTEWKIVGNKKKKTNDGVFGGKCMIKV